jgi:hypothetical protein
VKDDDDDDDDGSRTGFIGRISNAYNHKNNEDDDDSGWSTRVTTGNASSTSNDGWMEPKIDM